MTTPTTQGLEGLAQWLRKVAPSQFPGRHMDLYRWADAVVAATPKGDVEMSALEDAYDEGWVECAAWASREDLITDCDSKRYDDDRKARLDRLATRHPACSLPVQPAEAPRAALPVPLQGPVAYVNAGELNNIPDGRVLLVQGAPSIWCDTPLYRSAQDAGWRPIATAPKVRGKAFLVWCQERRNTYVVTCEPEGESPTGWRHFGGSNGELLEDPTHWQPLPAAPEAAPTAQPMKE